MTVIDVTIIVTFVLSTMEKLAELASVHAGHFTTSEASRAGVSRRALSHHGSTGTLERVEYGIYRLAAYPAQRLEDLIVVSLWAGDEAALSHESALVVYDLGDAMPAVVHVTVPRRFRGRRAGVIVHQAPLPPSETMIVDAVPVTSVERTIRDLAASGEPSQTRQAAQEALERGLTTRRRLRQAVGPDHPAGSLLAPLLRP